MNVIVFILALIVGGIPISEDQIAHETHGDGQMCITAQRIIKATMSWIILKTEVKYHGKEPFLEISVHNPINKTVPQSIDAKFILAIDPTAPSDPQKYNLVEAFYFNPKANVTFKRIYSMQDVMVKNKLKKFPIQTPCFARQVMPIIQFEPNVPGGGTK